MRRHLLMTSGMMFIFSTFAMAQDSLKTTNLQEIIISASRAEQSVIETPRSATVINRDVIERSLYNSVGELLTSTNSIYVVGANQTPGTNQSLFMRGMSSNQFVVMMDGVRITDPSSPNAAIDLSELSLTNVERIEIIRGSHSTIYGGAAIGGVVNIITKKKQAHGIHGSASLQAGTMGESSSVFTENASLQYTSGTGFYINGTLFQQNVNGLDATIDRENPTGTYSSSDEDDFTKTDGFFKVGLKNSSWDVFASYRRSNQQAAIDNGAYSDDDNNQLDFQRDLWEYHIRYNLNERWQAAAIGSWSNSLRTNENDSSRINLNGDYDKSFFKGVYHGRLQTHELQFNYHHENVRAVTGAGLYYEKMFFNTYFFYNDPSFPFESKTNYDSINTALSTKYLFGQLEYGVKNFIISLGTRFTHHELTGANWTAEFNPSYKLPGALIYFSLSSGFNSPSLYQLYDPTKGFGAITTRGNKELEPETSLSLEVGVKREFRNGSYFTIGAYQTQVKNSIEYIYLWEGSKPVSELGFSDNRGDTYVNIAKQNVQGLELDGHVIIIPQLFFNANLSWLSGKISASPEDMNNSQTGGNHVQLYNFGTFLTGNYDNKKLTRRPNVTTFMQLGYSPAAALTFTATHRYAGARYDVGYDFTLGPYGALKQLKVNSYSLIDVGANWQINKIFAAGIKLENIFDEEYYEIAGFQSRGRSGYLKLSARF
jgi:vitamin B12 transporter